jgi:hypothetical protein
MRATQLLVPSGGRAPSVEVVVRVVPGGGRLSNAIEPRLLYAGCFKRHRPPTSRFMARGPGYFSTCDILFLPRARGGEGGHQAPMRSAPYVRPGEGDILRGIGRGSRSSRAPRNRVYGLLERRRKRKNSALRVPRASRWTYHRAPASSRHEFSLATELSHARDRPCESMVFFGHAACFGIRKSKL